MQRLHMSQCFDTWSSNVDYLGQVRRKVQRCVMQMTHRNLVHSFETWLSYVDEQHALAYAQSKANRMADARRQDIMYTSLMAWAERAHAWRAKRYRVVMHKIHISIANVLIEEKHQREAEKKADHIVFGSDLFFRVDVSKLYVTFLWLKKNNGCYKDIKWCNE